MQAIAHVDGGSRGNPGDAAFGVAICDVEGKQIAAFGDFIGSTTNNQAEYRGLLAALEWGRANGVTVLHVLSDSQLMVRQMNGQYRVKNAGLRPLFQEARRLADSFSRFSIEHVRREKNVDADRLANLAMDARGPVSATGE